MTEASASVCLILASALVINLIQIWWCVLGTLMRFHLTLEFDLHEHSLQVFFS